MSQELIKSLIIWLPTVLFILNLGIYFLWGVIRGLRKSVILLIQASISMAICVAIFFTIVKSENIDQTMVSIANYILNMFGTSVQSLLGVSSELTSVKDIILDIMLKSMTTEELFYHVIIDSSAYLSALIELVYRIVLYIILAFLHVFMVFFMYIIYHIFYPVRRKIRRHKRQLENGEVKEPYKRRRFMGGLIGVFRGVVVSVAQMSFIGALLFVVTGKNNPMPDRNAGTNEEISFGDETINFGYDIYSYVCEMSDTGIFKVLNNIKDQENIPYYFYICDLILQGNIQDDNLGISDTFYVRRELGAYLGFVKDAASLIIKYAGADTTEVINGGGKDALTVMMDIVKDENFVNDFSTLIDEFESKSFVIDLSLNALTSIINNIDLALGADSLVTKLIQKVFNPETGIKITDLVTEKDIKGLFKSVLSITSKALNDMDSEKKARQSLNAGFDLESFDINLAFKYAGLLLDEVLSLSLFNERKDVGNKFFKNVYEFCAEEIVGDESVLPNIQVDAWIDELNILFDSVDYMLNIASVIYDEDMNVMINNALTMFDGESGVTVEKDFDALIKRLSQSSLLDIVFKAFVPGTVLDEILQNLTNNVEATMPKKFTIGSTSTETGELEILLNVVKLFIKNGGATIYEAITDGVIDTEDLNKIFDVLNKDLNDDPLVEEKLVDKLLESKALTYFLSSFVMYIELGDISLHITESALESIVETETVIDDNGDKTTINKTYKIIKKEELSTLFDFVLSSSDLVTGLLGEGEIDYVSILTSDNVINLLKSSSLIKGVISGLIISFTKDIDLVVLPLGYDDPEKWITDGEVDALVDAISKLKDETTKSGESLINSMMGGNIDIGSILNISENTIREMYKSKVLKYTISNAITSLTGDDFAIIIPAFACETRNALTTNTEKTVNIVSADELVSIFKQVNNIVDTSDSEIKVLYSNIFNNKKEILSSYIIQATIINLLVNMSSGEDSFISIPEDYVTAYNELKDAETIESLTNNKWLKSNNYTLLPEDSTVMDDELYLLFNAIQSLLGDECLTKDEQGNEIVSDNFEIDSIGDSIKIKKSSIDTLTSSYILNATLSDTITANFDTPITALDNNVIKKNELENLLDSLFIVLNKRNSDDSLTLDDVQNINIDTIKVVKSDFNNYHKKSSIFMTAFSSMIMDVENIYVPVGVTVEVETVKNKEYKVVNRIIDETINPSNNEFDSVVDCLFEILGEEDETVGDKVLNLDNFENVSDFKITEEKINVITSSKIFTASMSVILCEDDTLIVPETNDSGEVCTILVDMVNQENSKYILTQEEFGNTLHSLLEMFGKVNSETNVKELGLDIDLTDFMINDNIINKIVESAVLSATISDYLVDKDIAVIPNIDDVIEDINIIKSGLINPAYRVVQSELTSFMTTALQLFGSVNPDTEEKELNINNINLNDFVISNDNVEYLDDSMIINATTTKELAKIDSLVIPVYSNGEEVVEIHPVINSFNSCATIKEIVEFMKEMIELFGGPINPANLSTFELTLVKNDDLEGILWATFSKQLIDNNSILIPYSNGDTITTESTLQYDDVNGIYTSEMNLVSLQETNSFKDSLIQVLSNSDVLTINLDAGVKTEDMEFSPEDISSDDGIFASEIFTATVAKSVLELDTLKVPSIVKVDELFYSNEEVVKTLRVDQVKALFNSLFVSTKGENIRINDFNTNRMTLPTDRTDINKMLESLIVAATMSEEIVNKSSDSIVILEKVMGHYEYDYDLDNLVETDEEVYINKEELTNLIQALTVGLGKTVIADLTFNQVEIPTSENVDILTASDLLRATITREVMSQEGGLTVEESICDIEYKYNSNDKVMVINQDEIRLLIAGLEALDSGKTEDNKNNNFDNIKIDIKELAADVNKLSGVAASSILRSILAGTLKTETPVPYVGVVPYYQIIGMSDPVSVRVYKSFEVTDVIIYDTLFTEEQVLTIAGKVL